MRNRTQKRNPTFMMAVGFLYLLTFGVLFLLMFAREARQGGTAG